jgi:hypothetical protein
MLKWTLLTVAILGIVWFGISLIKYFRERKTNGTKQKFYLTQAILALLATIGAGLGFYQIKKKEEEKDEGT